MSTCARGRCRLPEPGAHRVRLRGGRPRAGAVRRPSPRSARWSPSRSCCGRGPAGRRRGWPRRRAACSTRSACRARASTRSSPTTCPGWPSTAPAPSCRIAGSSVEDYAELAERLRGVPGVLGLEVNISCPNVESRGQVFACDPVAASEVVAAVRAGRRPGAPGASPSSAPDVTDIVAVARAVRRRRRRRAVDDQHAARAGHRPRHDAPGARRGHRRAVRPGDPAGRAALRLAGARRRCPRCRSSAWAASAPAWTRSSSCWPARRAVSVGTAVFNDPSRGRPGARRARPTGASARARLRLRLADAVGYAQPMTTAARSASGCRRRRRPRAAVRRHRPAPAAAGEVGPARRRRRAWPGSPTRSSTRSPAGSPSSSRSWPSSSGTASRGLAVLEAACRGRGPPARWCCSTPSAATSARRWTPTPTTCGPTSRSRSTR